MQSNQWTLKLSYLFIVESYESRCLLSPLQDRGDSAQNITTESLNHTHHLGNSKKNKGNKRFFMTSLWISQTKSQHHGTSQLPHRTWDFTQIPSQTPHLEHALAVRSHLGQLAGTEPLRLVSFTTNDGPAREKIVIYHHGK